MSAFETDGVHVIGDLSGDAAIPLFAFVERADGDLACENSGQHLAQKLKQSEVLSSPDPVFLFYHHTEDPEEPRGSREREEQQGAYTFIMPEACILARFGWKVDDRMQAYPFARVKFGECPWPA
jgi:hypothetical protein